MNCYEIMKLKAELLCFGIYVVPEIKAAMQRINPYSCDHSFVHASHFIIERQNINTCVSEDFCKKSPFTIIRENDSLILCKSENAVCEIEVLPAPAWCNKKVDGEVIGNYLRPHSKNCIVCWPILSCDYYHKMEQCHFCSMGDYHIHSSLPERTVVQMIKTAMSYGSNYEVSLGGGIQNGRDCTFAYFSSVCHSIKKLGVNNISLEIAPPDDLDNIDFLNESGATAIIMNLEIANESLRKKRCPGKGQIPLRHYFDAYERAVKVFGRGNVSCVLLSGIQPETDIVDMSAKLIDMGVIPTILPFKPVDGCAMRNWPTADPEELVRIAMKNSRLLMSKGLSASKQPGCTRCNACSLETLAELV